MAKIPTQSAIPQKSGKPAVADDSAIVASAASPPVIDPATTLPSAALSAPAAKKNPHDTNAAGRTRWKLLGRARPLPRSPAANQWNVKLSENSVHAKARTPIAMASGSVALIRLVMSGAPLTAPGRWMVHGPSRDGERLPKSVSGAPVSLRHRHADSRR